MKMRIMFILDSALYGKHGPGTNHWIEKETKKE